MWLTIPVPEWAHDVFVWVAVCYFLSLEGDPCSKQHQLPLGWAGNGPHGNGIKKRRHPLRDVYGTSGAGAGVAAHMQPQPPPATPALSAYQPHQSHPRAQKQKPRASRGASTQTFSSKPLDIKLRLAISPHSSHLLCRARRLNRRPGCPGRDHHGRTSRSPVPLLDNSRYPAPHLEVGHVGTQGPPGRPGTLPTCHARVLRCTGAGVSRGRCPSPQG